MVVTVVGSWQGGGGQGTESCLRVHTVWYHRYGTTPYDNHSCPLLLRRQRRSNEEALSKFLSTGYCDRGALSTGYCDSIAIHRLLEERKISIQHLSVS